MRSSRSIGIAAALAVAAAPTASLAAEATETGLCRADEHVAFSCPIAAKTVSLCVSGEAGRAGAIAYRYGTQDKVENEFVARADNANRFFATVSPAGPGASVNQVWFDRGDVRYLLTECIGGNCPKQAGLAVLRGERVVVDARCTRVREGDHASFLRDLVTFGSDAASSRSSTPLLRIEDADNALEQLYAPHRRPAP